jgi:xylan 1,4-beta-xylosidase
LPFLIAGFYAKRCGFRYTVTTPIGRNLTRKLIRTLPLALLAAVVLSAQQRVTITVDLSKLMGRFEPVWAWVGHDEPNYTYSEEGRELLTRLARLSPYPVHDRTHNLLTSGDGTPARKWGSTNAFTRDANGKPVYNWNIVDQIFDTYQATGITPFVEIGFMPEALSPHSEPYRHHWPKDFDTGWAYPPNNYQEWSDLIYGWVRHLADRYGTAEVAGWEWEVWNEPDIFYWHGSVDEYNKFYDYTVAAVRRALPNARVGGPATTGPASQRAAGFLRAFLEHCARGQNYATGKMGAPLDFISFHAKGKAIVVDGHVQLNIGANLRDIDQGFALIETFPTFRQLPVVLSESDPESCAACDATSHPQNQYRLTSQYATYEAELLHGTLALAERHHINLEGTIAWAFTFPGQPVFAGLRAFTTNDIDLPVLNAFRMFGLMKGERVAAESTGALAVGDVLESSVKANPDVKAFATSDSHTANALLWSYHDDSNQSAPVEIRLRIGGLPQGVSRVLLEHWGVDGDRSNAYTAWRAMGSPQNPSADEYERLKAAGQLQSRESPRWIAVAQGNSVEITFTQPAQGLSLLHITW